MLNTYAAQIIAPSSTLIGLLVGWTLNQISTWYKGRQEYHKLRKEVLFNLLELNHLISKISYYHQKP